MRKVLVISYLFPNTRYPNRGLFVLRRLKAVSANVELKVINPIPWFPFCSRFRHFRDYDRIPLCEEIDGLEIHHPRFLAIPKTAKIIAVIAYCVAVFRLARRMRRAWNFELIDLHWTFPDLPAGKACAIWWRLPIVVTVRGFAALYGKGASLSRLLVRTLLRKCDHVITLSDELRHECVTQGVSADRCTTIHNGVDTSRFHYRPQCESRKALGLAANRVLVLSVGYVTPNKGFSRVVSALAKLRDVGVTAHFYVAGPTGEFAQGDCSAELWELARELNVDDQVHLLGEVDNDELVNWYNAADCFCLSSHSEGCPNVLMEALACGCPVVATRVGAVPDLVCEPDAGVVVSNTTDGIVDGLVEVLQRSFFRQCNADQMQSWQWSSVAQKVLGCYSASESSVGPCDGADRRRQSCHISEVDS